MKRAPLAALCPWLALPFWQAAADGPAVLRRYEQASADHSPASAAVLDDAAFMLALRQSDPGKATLLLRDKAQIRDLESLVERYPDEDSLRRVLRSKSSEFFDDLFRSADAGPVPEKLVDWVRRHHGPEPAKRFRAAVWGWETLPKEAASYLAAARVGKAAWDKQPFRWRDEQLQAWAKPLLEEVMKSPTPWTPEQSKRILLQVWAAKGLMSPEQWSATWTRINNENRLGEGLAKMQGKPLGPEMKAQLQRARDPKLPLEAQLAALARVFEGAGASGGVTPRETQELARIRQGRASETFTPDQRRLLADMLPRAYLKQVAKSGYPGLNDYYKTHALKIRVEATPGALAVYDPPTHQIKMSVKEIETWVRQQNLAVGDLLAKKEVFERFIMQSSPVFVHEASHQRQFEGSKMEDAALHSQAFEIQAMYEQTVYTKLLSLKDKRMAAFLAEEWRTSSLAMMYNQLDDAMRESPRKFRQLVASGYYCAYPSLHAVAAVRLEASRQQIKSFEAELKARGAGPAPAKVDPAVIAKIMASGYAKLTPETLGAWLKKAKTEQVQAIVAALRQDQLAHADWYTAMERWDRELPGEMDKFWKDYYRATPTTRPA